MGDLLSRSADLDGLHAPPVFHSCVLLVENLDVHDQVFRQRLDHVWREGVHQNFLDIHHGGLWLVTIFDSRSWRLLQHLPGWALHVAFLVVDAVNKRTRAAGTIIEAGDAFEFDGHTFIFRVLEGRFVKGPGHLEYSLVSQPDSDGVR